MSVFRAVDVACGFTVDIKVTRADAFAADDDAYAAYADAFDAFAADDAAFAAYAAAFAAFAAFAADDAAYAAAAAAYAAAAADANFFKFRADANTYTEQMKNAIRNDLQIIKEGTQKKFNNDTGIYADAWHDFLESLENIGCGYWAKLYKDLFENGFVLDKAELKRRLNIPDEIRKQGAAAVAKVLSGMKEQGEKRLNEARIVILGEKGAGKTSLARKLLNPDDDLPESHESTEGVDVASWLIPTKGEDNGVKAYIWDFAGHVITHAAHSFFLSERCIYIIVYDGRTETRNRLEYWLDHVKNYGGNSPVYILVNKLDEHNPKVSENTLRSKYSAIQKVISLSLKKDIGKITAFRDELQDYIRSSPAWSGEIPALWHDMKEILLNRFSPVSDHISIAEFEKIADSIKIKKEDLSLVRKSLHNLGICLWYEKIKNLDELVINPNWISFGVYKIINWMNDEKRNSLRLEDFSKIFKKEEDAKRYPDKKYHFLFKIMEAYKLAYTVKNQGKEELIIPFLLEEDRPYPDMEREFPIDTSLLMRYRMESALPPDTITRFIVQHHEDIMTNTSNKQLVWRYGAKMHDKNENEALIIEDDRDIKVFVKGSTAKDYLSRLRATLNEIFESYKSDNPALEYKITVTGEQPIFVSDRTILAYKNDGRMYLEPNTGQEFSMMIMGDMYNVSGNSAILKGDRSILINNSPDAFIINKVPEDLNKEYFNEILKSFKVYLDSEESKEELSGKSRRELGAEIRVAEEADYRKGWDILRSAISVGGDIGAVVAGVIAVNPNLPEHINNLLRMLL
jgi:small GTP-binding protein